MSPQARWERVPFILLLFIFICKALQVHFVSVVLLPTGVSSCSFICTEAKVMTLCCTSLFEVCSESRSVLHKLLSSFCLGQSPKLKSFICRAAVSSSPLTESHEKTSRLRVKSLRFSSLSQSHTIHRYLYGVSYKIEASYKNHQDCLLVLYRKPWPEIHFIEGYL